MPILSIRHVTRYRYRNPVALGEHRMMFRPRESYDQRILACELAITPTPTSLRSMHDVFGNCVGVAGFGGRTDTLVFDSRVRLEHTPLPAFADLGGEIEAYTGAMPFAYSPEDLPDLRQSLERQYPDPEGLIDRWARRFVRRTGRTSLQGLLSD
ncbi:MAG: transglutaminase N-terminal domain-containing protein, partial [Phenylobacterium sp.]